MVELTTAKQRTPPSSVPPPPSSGRGAARRAALADPLTLGSVGPDGPCFDLTLSRALNGDFDVDAIAATIPAWYTMPGMFFIQVSSHEAFSAVAPKLMSPPRFGRYLPFSDYPVRDFLLLFDVTARSAHPNRSPRDACRLRARSEVEVFARSRLGQITAMLVDRPQVALLKYPEMVQRLVKGPQATAAVQGPRSVKIALTQHYGIVEYTIGILEALVMAFDVVPTIRVDQQVPDCPSFIVSWN